MKSFWHKGVLAIRHQEILQRHSKQQTSLKRYLGERHRRVTASEWEERQHRARLRGRFFEGLWSMLSELVEGYSATGSIAWPLALKHWRLTVTGWGFPRRRAWGRPEAGWLCFLPYRKTYFKCGLHHSVRKGGMEPHSPFVSLPPPWGCDALTAVVTTLWTTIQIELLLRCFCQVFCCNNLQSN